ncbi:MAG: glycosyltransferase, partial [Gammaproteobacteria bacterium]|nr:glycosyltransferase [Gammaproteobacteria bacterium]NIO62372.1 glycosyltransferase [Gammaproteobacteria bacterium]NIT41732.1 glycosyltransferase [Gammaproteobacteria bacterium]
DKLRQNTDLRWIIIGDGRQREWLVQKIKEYRLDNAIYLLGQHPVDSMPMYFSMADALLVTLKRDKIFELTIPSKIQSYLACGRPILGALDGEGANIINDSGAGYAVPAGDAEALANAVLKMYQSTEEERTQMGLNGRKYYEQHFDRELLFGRLEDIMKAAIEENS